MNQIFNVFFEGAVFTFAFKMADSKLVTSGISVFYLKDKRPCFLQFRRKMFLSYCRNWFDKIYVFNSSNLIMIKGI